MEVYQYKAVNGQGRVMRGKVDAVNPADLEMRLGRLGLELIKCTELKSRGRKLTGKGVKRVDLITFCFHLEQLVKAGVPLLEGLTDLRDSVDNPRLSEVISAMIESIQGGKTLSESMRDFPKVFGEVFINLIRVGEQSGQLSEVLRHMTESLKWQDEQAAQTRKLFMYPSFIMVVVGGVLFFLMTYLVPQLVKFITNMGQELPFHTRALIAVSDFFVNYWYLLLSAPVVLFVLGGMLLKSSPAARLRFDSIILRVPVLGEILEKLILTRFANFFAIMYSSGITVLDCIRVGQDIIGNKAIEGAVRLAGDKIADGTGISASFEATGLFPPLVIRMLKVGENTGALETALMNVSYFYSRDVKESIERLQTMIEPAMTVTLGLILAWVMFSVLGPIYDLITKIKI
jgi:type IV pilus assembly protein PilC